MPPIQTTFWVKPLSVARLSSNPVSLFELSIQLRLICELDAADAARLLGAFGAVAVVVAVTAAVNAEVEVITVQPVGRSLSV